MKTISRILIKKRKGVAQAIFVWLLSLILVAAIYIPLNFAVQTYSQIQQQMWPTGFFDPSTLTFVNNYWLFLPAILFFIGIGYVYIRAQRQGPD